MNTAQEGGVMERNCNDQRLAECKARMEDIGLGEYLDQVIATPWQIPISQIICNHRGKAVVCQTTWSDHIIKSFDGLLGRKIEALKLSNGDEKIIVFTSRQSLTVPERHTLDTMNAYFESNYPGFTCDGEWVLFPEAMTPYAAPAEYENEDDAFEAAEVLSSVSGMDSKVIESGNGYAVVLHDRFGDMTDINALWIIGAVEVLQNFHCTRKEKPQSRIDGNNGPSAWQRRTVKRYNQQQRIEDGINAILAHLGHPEAEGRESIPPASGKRGKGLDALLSPSGKPTGKPSSKRSA